MSISSKVLMRVLGQQKVVLVHLLQSLTLKTDLHLSNDGKTELVCDCVMIPIVMNGIDNCLPFFILTEESASHTQGNDDIQSTTQESPP